MCDCELCSILIVFLFVFLWLVALLWPYVSTKTLLPNRVKQYAVVDEEIHVTKAITSTYLEITSNWPRHLFFTCASHPL